MSVKRYAVSGLGVLLLAAGCAYDQGSTRPQVALGQTLLAAYQETVSTQGVAASVEETVQSGSEPVAAGKGSSALWFGQLAGQLQLTVDSSTTTVIAVRISDKFYQGNTQPALAKNEQDLVQTGRQNPSKLPQIQTPGLDPFQLTTLLSAVQWPDTVTDLGPVVVADSASQHTEYQVTIDTAKLARHKSGADNIWLLAMSKEPNGSRVTLDVTLNAGKISVVTARLPIPSPQVTADPHKSMGPSAMPLQTLQPMSIILTEVFDYQQSVAKVPPPA